MLNNFKRVFETLGSVMAEFWEEVVNGVKNHNNMMMNLTFFSFIGAYLFLILSIVAPFFIMLSYLSFFILTVVVIRDLVVASSNVNYPGPKGMMFLKVYILLLLTGDLCAILSFMDPKYVMGFYIVHFLSFLSLTVVDDIKDEDEKGGP